MTNFDPTADLTATTAELHAQLEATIGAPIDIDHGVSEADGHYIGFDRASDGAPIWKVESEGGGYVVVDYTKGDGLGVVLAAGATPVEAMRKAMGQ